MEAKIMYGALMIVAGWVYFYICIRQLVFDFTVGYPIIRLFATDDDRLIVAKPARNLNTVSVCVWFLLCGVLGFLVVWFCSLWLMIPFWVGVIVGVVCYINKLGPKTKSNMDAWMRTYYRFMPDDELRTACYHTDYPRIRAALRALDSDVTISFK